MKKWKFTIPLFLGTLGVACYAFRSERLFVNQRVHEELPIAKGDSPVQTFASATFHSVLHGSTGTATIYRLRDGSRVLRLTNFRTSNGPDVHVYIVAADNATDSVGVRRAGFIDLGSIKANIDDQNYALGSDVDLSKYHAVSVYCKRFSLNIGTAPLTPDRTMSFSSPLR
jgi:Electron transfer DM13